jgi:hypothetical protein
MIVTELFGEPLLNLNPRHTFTMTLLIELTRTTFACGHSSFSQPSTRGRP